MSSSAERLRRNVFSPPWRTPRLKRESGANPFGKSGFDGSVRLMSGSARSSTEKGMPFFASSPRTRGAHEGTSDRPYASSSAPLRPRTAASDAREVPPPLLAAGEHVRELEVAHRLRVVGGAAGEPGSEEQVVPAPVRVRDRREGLLGRGGVVGGAVA